MIKGRHEDALKSLARLHSRGNINDQFVQGEYQEMLSKVQEEATMEGGWALVRRLATHPSYIFTDILDLQGQDQSPKGLLRDHSAILGSDDRCFCHSILRGTSVFLCGLRGQRPLDQQYQQRYGYRRTNSLCFVPG